MKRLPLALVVTLAVASLSTSCETSNEVITVFLQPNKGACADGGLCLIARAENDDAYRLVEYIRGFRFRWGYDYELRIELKPERSLGRMTHEWVLDDVEKRDEAPGATFELCLTDDMIADLDLERRRGWIGEELREFTFGEELTAKVLAFQENGFGLGSFEFSSDVDDPIVLTDMSVALEAPCEGPIPEYVPEDPGGASPVN